VSEKQETRARQVFDSSAEQTGFREQGANRLVLPAVVVSPPQPLPSGKESGGGHGGDNRGGTDIDLDPLLLALLHKIPKRNEEWPEEKRLRWFKTFAMNVSQVYDEDNNPVELTIELKSKMQFRLHAHWSMSSRSAA
jgi:hypothetical protein